MSKSTIGGGHKSNNAMRKKREHYRSLGSKEKNRIKKLIKHLKKYPNDKIARIAKEEK